MAYLDSFPNSFDTDRIKINWVGSLLTDTAQDWHQYRMKRNKITSQEESWTSYCTAIKDRFTDAAEASTNFERMINLETHVARKLPKQIIRLVYSAGGNVPEDDDEFVKAIATAGRLYEKMLANPGTGYTAKAKAYKQKNFTQDKHHRNQHSQGELRPQIPRI
ncbi:hypothetical protein E4U57_004800 [Claviceps arundinis]|uniref:Retrotransposon gag domain-containing protein n=1 Tax=Claviceps arundinis TaxID=1623583 RepID=A0ABQ7P4B6_9HYPO|nr:hypothetical protein E4U57_004800 [Claviceps arundinis]